MSDKTTEEAAMENESDFASKVRLAMNNIGVDDKNGTTYYALEVGVDADGIELAIFEIMEAYNTTIAQLREENEMYHKCLEFLRQEAYASEPYLYSPDVLAFIEKALTPKG